jgi:hypothetical protein
MNHSNVGKAFGRCLNAAGLPGHFTPHSLRHTYASLLLADGVSPAYVQEQLGHASIELTVGTYGRWLRKRAPGAVDRLDETPAEEKAAAAGLAETPSPETARPARGSSLVATGPSNWKRRPQVVERVGDPRRTRTYNPEIKSLMVDCRLSWGSWWTQADVARDASLVRDIDRVLEGRGCSVRFSGARRARSPARGLRQGSAMRRSRRCARPCGRRCRRAWPWA